MAYPARYADIKAIVNRHFALRGVGSVLWCFYHRVVSFGLDIGLTGLLVVVVTIVHQGTELYQAFRIGIDPGFPRYKIIFYGCSQLENF